MYCVVYEFKIRPGKTTSFEKSWGEYTDAIYRACGSLGSRLHKTTDPLVYVAYAQWPSKEIFERDVPLSAYSAEELQARSTMKDAVENTKKVYFLEMVGDHLKHT